MFFLRHIIFVLFLAITITLFCGCGGGGKKGSTGGALPSNGESSVSYGQGTFSVSSFAANQTGILISTQQPSGDSSTVSASATVASTPSKMELLSNSSGKFALMLKASNHDGDGLKRDLPWISDKRIRSKMLFRMMRHVSCANYSHSSTASDTFSIYNINTNSKQNITLYNRTPGSAAKTLVFVEQQNGSDVVSAATIASIVSAFETNNPYDSSRQGIYYRMRDLFGSEWNNGGGSDGEDKIIFCIISSNSLGGNSLLGYFNQEDELSCKGESSGDTSVPDSNQGEIIYINATYFNQVSDGVTTMFDGLATIVHEFQHIINYNNKYIRQGTKNGTEENTTINEGISMLAEQELGYSLSPTAGGGNQFLFNAIKAYEDNPHGGSAPSFFGFNSANRDYGKGYLLINYIRDRFGLNTITTLTTSSGTGSSGITSATGISFNTLFQDWAKTNYLDCTSGIVPAAFKYSNLNMCGNYITRNPITGATSSNSLPGIQMAQTISAAGSNSINVTIQPWTAAYFLFNNGTGSTLTVTVNAPTTTQSNFIYEAPTGTFNSIQ